MEAGGTERENMYEGSKIYIEKRVEDKKMRQARGRRKAEGGMEAGDAGRERICTREARYREEGK